MIVSVHGIYMKCPKTFSHRNWRKKEPTVTGVNTEAGRDEEDEEDVEVMGETDTDTTTNANANTPPPKK